jgi:hypothetical protein
MAHQKKWFAWILFPCNAATVIDGEIEEFDEDGRPGLLISPSFTY